MEYSNFPKSNNFAVLPMDVVFGCKVIFTQLEHKMEGGGVGVDNLKLIFVVNLSRFGTIWEIGKDQNIIFDGFCVKTFASMGEICLHN